MSEFAYFFVEVKVRFNESNWVRFLLFVLNLKKKTPHKQKILFRTSLVVGPLKLQRSLVQKCWNHDWDSSEQITFSKLSKTKKFSIFCRTSLGFKQNYIYIDTHIRFILLFACFLWLTLDAHRILFNATSTGIFSNGTLKFM